MTYILEIVYGLCIILSFVPWTVAHLRIKKLENAPPITISVKPIDVVPPIPLHVSIVKKESDKPRRTKRTNTKKPKA